MKEVLDKLPTNADNSDLSGDEHFTVSQYYLAHIKDPELNHYLTAVKKGEDEDNIYHEVLIEANKKNDVTTSEYLKKDENTISVEINTKLNTHLKNQKRYFFFTSADPKKDVLNELRTIINTIKDKEQLSNVIRDWKKSYNTKYKKTNLDLISDPRNPIEKMIKLLGIRAFSIQTKIGTTD
jgi:hypothetical protein